MNTRFGGYLTERGGREDAELTHVARGTPGGEYLRRFWHPLALASEVTDVPLAVRLLGEDLVLFRDGGGRLGLVHRRCSHRGASLEFGIASERGLRCCYHGWLYDIDGTILETPAEPETSRIRERLCHGAYPVVERAGLVFAYLGHPEARPALPRYDSLEWAADLAPFKLTYPCNWLQVHENTADPIHIPFLHGRVSGTPQFSPGFNELPALAFRETPLGLVVASTRWAGGRVWIRSADVMLPNVAQYPPAFETSEASRAVVGAWATRWITPMDDTSSWVIGYRHFDRAIDPDGQGRREEVGLESLDFAGQTAQVGAARQRNPGDWEAMVGQGPIAVHEDEHLCASDRGVTMLRNILRTRIRARTATGAEGGDGPGPLPTYTAEIALPCATAPTTAQLADLGERALRHLVEHAVEPRAVRSQRLASHIREALACR